MPPNPQVFLLVTQQVLPQHQGHHHDDDDRAAEFQRPLTDWPQAGGLGEQERFARADGFVAQHDRLAFFGGDDGGRDVFSGRIATALRIDVVVFKIRDNQRTQNLTEEFAIVSVIVSRPDELLGAQRGARSDLIQDAAEIADDGFLPTVNITPDYGGYTEAPKLAP